MKIACIFLVLPLVFLSACATRMKTPVKQFSFSVTFSPKYPLKPDTNIILIINQVDLDGKGIRSKDLGVTKAGAYTAIKYACKKLMTLPHVHVINLTDSVLFAANFNSIATLAAKYHSDYVFAMTDYNAQMTTDDADNPATFYMKIVDLKFTMFVGDGSLSRNMYGNSTSSNTGLFADSKIIKPTVAGNRKFVMAATPYAVDAALRDFMPYTTSNSRPLYDNGPLKPAVAEILAGNLEKARDLSQPLLLAKDPLIAGNVAYNLAVIYEAQGDKDKAIKLAQTSLDKHKNGYADDLITELKTVSTLFP